MANNTLLDDILHNAKFLESDKKTKEAAALGAPKTVKFSKETTKKPWEVTSGWETLASPQAKDLINAFKKITHLLDICYKNRDIQEDSFDIFVFAIDLDAGRPSLGQNRKLSFNYATIKKSHLISYNTTMFYDDYTKIGDILNRVVYDNKIPTKDEMGFLNEVYKKESKK